MDNSYFYHSFPRKHPDDIAYGLVVLESMLKSGLLLTPEIISWREPGRPMDQAPTFNALQTRTCFTELLPSQLIEHSKLFGCFALEFSVENLRELGAIPVFYVPNSAEIIRGFNGVGQALVVRLAQVQVLLERLRHLKNLEGGSKETPLKWSYNLSPQLAGELSNVFAAKEGITFASGGLVSLEELCFSIMALQNLLAPTENLDYTEPLYYYRQREWRIIDNFALNGVWPIRKLTDEERKRLLALDDFFQKELNHVPSGISRVIEGCRFFSELEGKLVFQRVRRILVPTDAVDAGRVLVKNAGLQVSVTDARNAVEEQTP